MMKKNETRIEQRVNKESLKNGAIAYEFRFFKIQKFSVTQPQTLKSYYVQNLQPACSSLCTDVPS